MAGTRSVAPEAAAASGGARGAVEAAAWYGRMLDEIDHGLIAVAAGDARVVYLNHAARAALDGHHPLQLLGGTLGARQPQDVTPLFDALDAAQRGLRRMLALGIGRSRVWISVVPLDRAGAAAGRGARPPLALLVLGRRTPCAPLTVLAYARSLGLTPAETRVLESLCEGLSANEIARRAGVAVSTVRTQIGGIRAKTGAGSIHALVRQLALLPPLVGALRPEVDAADFDRG